MRRRLAWALATILVLGGAACGSDGTTASSTTTAPTTTAPTTTASTVLADPAGDVDRFCAKTDELNAVAQEVGANPDQQPTPEQQARMQSIATEAAGMMFRLRESTADMLPGENARFQQCAAVLGGTDAILPEP